MGIIYGNGGFVKSRKNRYDPDAQVYITAVETADGQALEVAVKDAINAFVVGCKADGIWNAIKSCCILAGARTLTGALVQLIPNASPITNINFILADRDRTLGVKGNGTDKYLNTNRASNADPQDNQHLSVYVTESHLGSSGTYIDSGLDNGDSLITKSSITGRMVFRSRHPGGGSLTVEGFVNPTGFIGVNRGESNTVNTRVASITTNFNNNSVAPTASNILVFARPRFSATETEFANARIAFFSIGEALLTGDTGLALLDARITTYMNTLAELHL